MAANPKDLAILTALTGSVRSTEHYASSMAGELTDAGARDHVNQLATMLQEEANQLRSMSYATYQALKENEDKDNGESEDVSLDFLYAVYDQRNIDDRGPDNIKWYNPFTDIGDTSGSTRLTKKIGICFHHTAVAGGFGTHKSRRDAWTKNGLIWTPNVTMANGEVRQTIWPVQPQEEYLGTGDEALERWARAMALADRYRGYKSSQYNTGVPYHVVSGANSVLYLNLPFDWVTWHGNGSNNMYLGFGWDAKSSVDTFNPDDMRKDVLYVIDDGRKNGHFADGIEFTGHCAWTNKPSDPGKEFIELLIELAKEVGAEIRMDFKSSSSAKSFSEVLAA